MEPSRSLQSPDKVKEPESSSIAIVRSSDLNIIATTSAPDTATIEEIVGVKISSQSPKGVADFDHSPLQSRLKKRCTSSFSLPSRTSAIPTRGGKRYSESSLSGSGAKRDKFSSSTPTDLDLVQDSAQGAAFIPRMGEVIGEKTPTITHLPLDKAEAPLPPAPLLSGNKIPVLMDISTSDLTPSVETDYLHSLLLSLPTYLRHSLSNRYRPGVCGPFTVFIERISTTTEGGLSAPPSVLGLGRALHFIPTLRPFMEIAFDFRKSGLSRYSISFLKGNAANDFVEKASRYVERIRLGENWVVYIPDFRVKKRVVLFGIDDPKMETSLIKGNLYPTHNWRGSWIPPTDVELLQKKVPDENSEGGFKLIKGKTFIGTFENFELPSFVYFLGKKIFLRPFVNRIIQCKHCLRFGHFEKSCRKKQDDPVCFKCASTGHYGDSCQSTTIYCVNCVRGRLSDPIHRAVSTSCPVYIHNKHVKKIMAVHCMGPIEAENFIRVSGMDTSDDPDRFSGPPLFTLEDFWPQLLKVPSVVSYAGAVNRKTSDKDPTELSSSGNVGVRYPTKNSKFLSNLHILRKKKAERIKRLADRDTPIQIGTVLDTSVGTMRQRPVALSSHKEKVSSSTSAKGTYEQSNLNVLPSSKGSLTPNLQYINQSIFDSLNKSSNPMSKPLIKFFLKQFAPSSSSDFPESETSHLSLNKAHLKNLRNLFSEGLSFFDNLQL